MNEEIIDFKGFLETVPPLAVRVVQISPQLRGSWSVLLMPAITLYCSGQACRGPRFHDSEDEVALRRDNTFLQRLIVYKCRNCEAGHKTFALRITETRSESLPQIFKIGEHPRFGEPRPNVIADVLDDEIKYFEYGYRAEIDGLGIGAFAYYRRFVESHKAKIIAEIKKVAVAQSLGINIIDALDRADSKREFKAAVEEIKDLIPDSLKINGANPLTLLHNALSGGLHSDDDVECLQIAQDIRTVLTALADRTSELLKAETAIKAAVTRLNQRNSGQRS